MINKSRKSTVVLVGLFMLPTSAKFDFSNPQRCSAFKSGQDAYLLQASDEDGYPQAVIVTADADTLDWTVGDDVQTQHAQVRKNLPARFVKGILRADGSIEGELPPKGLSLPHWEYIPTSEGGGADMATVNEVTERLAANKERRERDAKQLKALKEQNKGKKAA